MKRILVRYKVKPEKSDENKRLVDAVYAELKEKAPPGFRYSTFCAQDGATFFQDGATFFHLASIETEDGRNPLAESAAFKAFQKDLKERCDEPPAPVELSTVGAYSFFD